MEVGTKVSRERGAAALFELDEETRAAAQSYSAKRDGGAKGGSVSDGSTVSPHVMMSYNWDHQDVIVRVVASLQRRGYLVWVDVE